jgi:hypothetical protein
MSLAGYYAAIGMISILICIPAVLIAIQYLNIRRDFLSLCIYLQFIVYLQVAPLLSVRYLAEAGDARVRFYLELMLASAFLFVMPFWGCYGLGRLVWRWLGNWRCRYRVTQVSFGSAAIFCGVLVLMFVVIVLNRGLVYMWNGNEENTRILQDLPTVDWWIYRGYQQSALIMGLTWLLVSRFSSWPVKSKVCAFVVIAPWFLWSMINTRSNIVIASIFIVSVLIRYGLNIKVLTKIILLLLFALYCIFVVINARTHWGTDKRLDLGVFVPARELDERSKVYGDGSMLCERLNGIDAMALMKAEVDRIGCDYGRSWLAPIRFSFLQPIYRILGKDCSDFSVGTTKVLLLRKYANIEVVDYSACMLTDVYGNLGYFGFPFASLFLGLLCGIASCAFNRLHPLLSVFGIFVYYSIFMFEIEFAGMLYGWLRSAVFTLPFIYILFRKTRSRFCITHPVGFA